MDWIGTYKILAEEIAATISDRPDDVKHLYNALLAIVDLTTVGDGSQEGYGREAEADLLIQMNLFYKQGRMHYAYNDWRRQMVKSINDFTIKYFGNLTKFINDINWDDGCVPFYWAELSEEAKFDTSGWIVCS